MTESYTPNQFINKINQDNPSSPTFDPLKTQELRQRIEDNKIQSGDILAQADEQRKQQEEYLNSPEAKIAKAEQEIQDMKTWLLTDQTYTPEEVDSMVDKLRVEYDPELDKAIVRGDIYLNQLESAKGLQLPETVGNDLNLSGLTSTEGLQLPKTVVGDLALHSLTSAEGLQLPKSVGGSLWLESLTSAEGLQLPGNIEGDLYLYNLTNAEGLQIPDNFGGYLYLDSLSPSDKQKLRELRPDLADKIL